MKKKTHSFASLSAVLLLGACSSIGSDAVSRLDSSYVLSGGHYSSGGGVTVAANVQNNGGKTMVCGVWAQSKRQSVVTKYVENRLLGSGAVFLDDEALTRGLNFMNEVEPAEDYSQQDAGCRITDLPWSDAYASKDIRVRIPRQVVYRDDNDFGGLYTVYFYPSGPSAGGTEERKPQY